MRKKINPLKMIIISILLLGSYVIAEPVSVLEAKVNESIKQFNKEIKGGGNFLSKVKGYLVFPSVLKGGFIVGGEYGEGALRIHGKTTHYYSMTSGSIGFQAGLQQRGVIFAFLSENALNHFIKSNGWEAGVDGSITIAKWGAGKDISSVSYEKPIYAFVFDAKGLMYNLTLEGTKFTKIIPK